VKGSAVHPALIMKERPRTRTRAVNSVPREAPRSGGDLAAKSIIARAADGNELSTRRSVRDSLRPRTVPALEGVRALDLTNVLAGPFCAYQLGLLGAEVIKLEIPDTGDLARQLGADPKLNARLMGASFLAQNGGKKSATVNLKTDGGREILRRLVRRADVLVENFRPGVMVRLGLGYEELQAINPGLIYCAISGYGQEGPMKDAPAYDQIIQGMSGVMSITGDKQSAPQRVGYPIADTIGGITAAFAIATALFRRATTGLGTFIDVSMLDCTLSTMGWIVSNYLIAGHEPTPMGNDNFTAAPSGTFRTGKGLLNIAANKQEHFEMLVEAVGLKDLAAHPRFADRESRKRHRTDLTIELEAALKSKTAVEWEAILNRLGIPAGRVVTVSEALRHPQIQERNLLQTFPNAPGLERPLTLTRTGFKMTGADPSVSAPPPMLGQHTDEVLREAGYSDREIVALREAKAI
jgi:crotonobetainyl-CoA:carnitine CoA-transferase CaiB-like acyl-CoA transferase